MIFPTSESAQGVKGQKGFTLTELLTVIAILGVLAAIAIPAFLSQRERARYRVMEADARGAVGEVQAALDGYHNRLPMVFLTEPEKGTCFEHATASNQSNKSCAVIYPGYPARSYSTLADVMDALATHYNTGREEKNPYDGAALLYYSGACTGIDTSASEGRVVICNATDSLGKILAFSEKGTLIYNSIVGAK